MEASLVLATMWHDPPWKPWGMMLQVSGDKMEIRGNKKVSVSERILNGLQKILENGYKKLLDDIIGRELDVDEVNKLLERTRSNHAVILRSSTDETASHEKQAALIPALLAAILEKYKEEAGSKPGEIDRIVGFLIDAGRKIVSRDRRIACADIHASALDRTLLRLSLEEYGNTRAEAMEAKIVNPFDPSIQAKLDIKLDQDRVALFLLNYTTTLARILIKALEDNNTSGEDLERLLRDSAFLLLEPIWYATMGEGYRSYIPPADTRLPTHTVFDHVNAALMTLLWCSSDGLKGSIAVVDLAGVQSWISESRALRDLWASSWIASLLAWKSIEALVEEYGPGVMVSPPARLTPFIASKLVLSKIGGNTTIEIGIPVPGPHSDRQTVEVELGKLLGLPHGWPVDPVTPSRLIIALPPGLGEDQLREDITRGIQEAWKEILGRSLDMVEQLSQALGEHGREGIATGLVGYAREVEAPLALRIYQVNIQDAIERARELLAGEVGDDKAREEYVKALYYNIALSMLFEKERELRVKVPGRRLGTGYYTYALEAHEHWKGKKATCTVCGKAPAIINGKTLRDNEEVVKKIMSVKGKEGQVDLFYEIREDRLCPYCLVKRTLRRMLIKNSALSYKLVGIETSEEAKKRLRFVTIDAYTSRVKLLENELKSKAEELADELADLLSDVYDGSGDCTRILPQPLNSVAKIDNRFIRDDDTERKCMKEAQSIILEVVHDKTLLKEALKALGEDEPHKKEPYKEVREILKDANRIAGKYRSKYGILVMDVDMMGSGVLSGKLGLRPEPHYREHYLDRIANMPPEAAKIFIDKYNKLLDVLEQHYKKLLGDGGGELEESKKRLLSMRPTMVITPSYHFAISRSLALQSMRDRDTIEELDGMVIYAGGDDLLAILPPVKLGDDGRYVYPVLETAARARKTYWGEGDVDKGMSVYRVKPINGDQRLVVGVAPSLRAYGRSAAAYIADVGTPMWISLATAHELEEAKDEVERLVSGNGVEWFKDILVVASDTGGASVLPFTWLHGDEHSVGLLDPARSVKNLLARVVGEKKGERGDLAKSIFSDYRENAPTIREVTRRSLGDTSIARSIVKRIIQRNKIAEEVDEESIHDNIVVGLGGDLAYTGEMCVKGGVAAEMLSSTGYVPAGERVCAPLITQAVLAARILAGSM
ncbi:MAG: hypothetical protein GSR84_02005 [Desulfurococcales archaeon]|nr:hypothetical protein [Desulfurococcales archaeon]